MKQRLQAFKYAFEGVRPLLKETHFRIHLCFAGIAIIISAYLDIDRKDWLFIGLSISLVLICEAFNTALEKLCDRVTRDRDPLIKIAKDVSALAVLMAAVFALVCGGVIWLDKL